MSTKAIATTQGSRPENEDYELILENDKFAIVLMLDGHGGEDMKYAVGEKLKEKLEDFIDVTKEDEEFRCVSTTLKEIYYNTLEYIDNLYSELHPKTSIEKIAFNLFFYENASPVTMENNEMSGHKLGDILYEKDQKK